MQGRKRATNWAQTSYQLGANERRSYGKLRTCGDSVKVLLVCTQMRGGSIDMIEQSFLNNVMLSALPFFCVLALWCFRYLEQRLPGKQQTALHEFVAQAVAMVEQMHGNAAPLQKKNLAIQATIDLFRAFHLPIPPISALSTAIEATVFAVHQASQYAPTQAMPVVRVQGIQGQAQRVDMANTLRVPAVKPQTQPIPMPGQQG